MGNRNTATSDADGDEGSEKRLGTNETRRLAPSAHRGMEIRGSIGASPLLHGQPMNHHRFNLLTSDPSDLRDDARRRKATRDAQTAAQQASVQTPDALLHLASVSARVGLRRSMLYKLMQAGTFPQPVRLGVRCVRWRAGDVATWLASKAGLAPASRPAGVGA